MSNFKVRYVRFNEPRRVFIRNNVQPDYKVDIAEVYFKEYENTFDMFFVTEGESKYYMTLIGVQKNMGDDTINIYINIIDSEDYKIDVNNIRKRKDQLLGLRNIETLLENIYGKE